MGLHKRHTHGRVFRGLEAREHLHVHKRDSHGDTPVMRPPQGFPQQQQGSNQENQPAVSVVYVTLPQTFSGAAIYSTLTADPEAAPTVDATPNFFSNPETHRSQAQNTRPTSLATVTPDKASNAASLTSLATASATSSYNINQLASSDSDGATALAGSPVQATHSPTSSALGQSQGSGGSGLSSGAQAGLAFGIIASIGVAAALIWFCWRRQKKVSAEEEAKLQTEKHASFADAGARQVEAGAKRGSTMTEKVPSSLRSTRTTSTAPRLSLRPVTQFLPNLGDNRNNLDVGAAGWSDKSKSSWERRPSHADQNPFDDAPAFSEKQGRPRSPQANPFDEPEGKKSSDSQLTAGHATTAYGGSPKSSWEGAEPATPRSAQFATAAAVPLAAGYGRDPPPPRGPNNVHRVQLDFKPSMDDELELRSGQLVRMLHEYDDGWALCIRMDRSQQGVAPRTCLSKLPVKPRPQGPQGPPPHSRPGTSQGPRRPSNPSQPMHGEPHGTMYPRPLTPTSANRSPSPTESNGAPSTAPVSVVPQRKPVPGQAM